MKNLSRALWALGGCVLTVAWGTYVLSVMSFRQAEASRNSSGTYTVFAGTTPVTSSQLITASLWNNAWNDMAADMTLSLDRNGRGGMLAALRGIDGTVAAPPFSFTSETGSGLFRNGAGDVRMAVLGSSAEQWTTNGSRFANGAIGTPSVSFINDTASGLYRIGSNDIGFAVNGVKVWESTATRLAALSSFSIGFNANPPNFTSNGTDLFINAGTTAQTIAIRPNGSGSSTGEFDIASTGATASAGLTIGTNVGADGSGFKHKRVASCTTPASASSTCDTTVTWGTAFADANYTVTCSGEGSPSGTPLAVGVASKTASAVTYRIACQTALASSFTSIDCVAVHD